MLQAMATATVNAMAQHPNYPHVSSFRDRHGKTRWRYRRAGETKGLPGEPHTPEFDATYRAIVKGHPTKADVIPFAGGVRPKSLKHAYLLLKQTDEWKGLNHTSRHRYGREIERLLMRKHKGNGELELGEGPLSELKRSNVKQILALYRATPHMQRIILICIAKLVLIGIEEEWIEVDPTHKMLKKYRPVTDGHPPWTLDQLEQFERHHKIGSPARVAYALGLWLGNRASDVAKLRWSQFVTKRITVNDQERVIAGFEFVQFKGRHKKPGPMFLPMSPYLETELASLSRETEFVLISARTKRGYTAASLSNRMIEWVAAARLPAGRDAGDAALSMHGLRKSLGIKMAEADASTRQMMDVFGHSDPKLMEVYTRKADQARMAIQAMDKVVAAEKRRQKSLRVAK